MADTWTIRLPYDKPPLTLNQRLHWRAEARIKHQVRADVTTLVTNARIPACHAIHVQLVYVPRDHRIRDCDNLVATLKPCIDAIRACDVVPDDSPQYVTWGMPIITAPDSKDPHMLLEITRKDT
jgi:crossover junction endodeoxyribonuclease RusA